LAALAKALAHYVDRIAAAGSRASCGADAERADSYWPMLALALATPAGACSATGRRAHLGRRRGGILLTLPILPQAGADSPPAHRAPCWRAIHRGPATAGRVDPGLLAITPWATAAALRRLAIGSLVNRWARPQSGRAGNKHGLFDTAVRKSMISADSNHHLNLCYGRSAPAALDERSNM
jgi:hypothetical protein